MIWLRFWALQLLSHLLTCELLQPLGPSGAGCRSGHPHPTSTQRASSSSAPEQITQVLKDDTNFAGERVKGVCPGVGPPVPGSIPMAASSHQPCLTPEEQVPGGARTGEQELCKPSHSETKWSPGGRGRQMGNATKAIWGRSSKPQVGCRCPSSGGGCCCPGKLEEHSPSPLPPSQGEMGHKNLSRSSPGGPMLLTGWAPLTTVADSFSLWVSLDVGVGPSRGVPLGAQAGVAPPSCTPVPGE